MARLSRAVAAALLFVAGVACVSALDGAQQKILSSADFPVSRPPLFKFRTYSDAKQVKCEVNAFGALVMTVAHKALKGVTPPMLLWLYSNMESGQSLHPVDKKVRAAARAACTRGSRRSVPCHHHDEKRLTLPPSPGLAPCRPMQMYNNFLMFHPRDHVKQTATAHPITSKGVKATFVRATPRPWRLHGQACFCVERHTPPGPRLASLADAAPAHPAGRVPPDRLQADQPGDDALGVQVRPGRGQPRRRAGNARPRLAVALPG